MSQLRNKLIIRFKPNPDSDALVRQSFRNAVGERRPRGGLEVLSGRFSRGCLPRAEARGLFCFPPRRMQNVQAADTASSKQYLGDQF
jgi:hypothetical protein